jgi:hypothetical protein
MGISVRTTDAQLASWIVVSHLRIHGRIEPTAVRGKKFEVNNLNHSAMDTPNTIVQPPVSN